MRNPWRPIAASSVLLSLAGPSLGQVTTRISVDSRGAQGNGFSQGARTSSDGRFVAFSSTATNLVPGDTNGHRDAYVRDRLLGLTERVSVSSTGVPANGDVYVSCISPDGRYVGFVGEASNLVDGDTNYRWDAFVHDRVTATTERVSVGSRGAQGNGYTTWGPVLSDDGRFAAFASESTNLVTRDANGTQEDIFLRDRRLGTTELVSVASSGLQGNSNSNDPCISADGRFVAFTSSATNLVSGDRNGMDDVFLRDLRLGTTEIVSVNSAGIQGVWYSYSPSISPDGRFIAFESASPNLVSRDTNGTYDVFVRDRLLGTTERVSVDSNGAQSHGYFGSHVPSISADGRFVAFESYDSGLVTGDTNGTLDVYLHDRRLGTTERLSVSSNGVQGRLESYFASISADGRFVAFQSVASDLVPGDTNQTSDVFMRDLHATGFTSLCEPASTGVIGCPCANPPSGPGRGCDNSAATGGATLSAAGVAHLLMDSLEFSTSDEPATAASVLIQGTSSSPSGLVYGQGVRCVGGRLKRLFTKTAMGGSITAPNLSAGDMTVSARSATLGHPISAGQSRYYFVYYRDPIVLGGCPASSKFNATQTGVVTWSP